MSVQIHTMSFPFKRQKAGLGVLTSQTSNIYAFDATTRLMGALLEQVGGDFLAGRKRIPVEVQEKSRKDNKKPHRSVKELESRKAAEARINENLPDAEPPAYLHDPDKIARFNEIVSLMKLAGPKTLAKALDSDAIAAYVDAQFNYEYLQKELDGLQNSKTPLHNLIESYSKLRNAAQSQCDRLRSVLALDPVSRLKIEAEPEEPKKNKFSAL